MFKFPWNRRAEAERKKRLKAQERLREIEAEGDRVRDHRAAVRREVVLNDWTGTAKDMFRGRD